MKPRKPRKSKRRMSFGAKMLTGSAAAATAIAFIIHKMSSRDFSESVDHAKGLEKRFTALLGKNCKLNLEKYIKTISYARHCWRRDFIQRYIEPITIALLCRNGKIKKGMRKNVAMTITQGSLTANLITVNSMIKGLQGGAKHFVDWATSEHGEPMLGTQETKEQVKKQIARSIGKDDKISNWIWLWVLANASLCRTVDPRSVKRRIQDMHDKPKYYNKYTSPRSALSRKRKSRKSRKRRKSRQRRRKSRF